MKAYNSQSRVGSGYYIVISLLFGIYLFSIIAFGQDTQSNYIANSAFLLLAIIQTFLILIRKKIQVRQFVFLFFPFLLLLIIGIVYAQNQEYAFVVLKTHILLLIFSFLTINSINCRRHLLYFIASIGIAGILISLYTVSIYGLDQILHSITYGYKERIGFEFGNPNGLGYLLAYGLLAISLSTYHLKNRFTRFFLFLLSGILFILIIASGSRRAMIICLIGLLLLNIYAKRGIGGKLIPIIFLVIIFLVIGEMPFFATYNKRIGSFFNLFTDPSTSETTDRNRIIHMQLGVDYISQRPFFGFGTGSYRFLSSNFFAFEASSHNNWVEMGVNNGLIGLIAYYGPLIYMLIKIWRKISTTRDLLGCLLFIFLVSEIFITGMTALTYISKISMAVISLCVSYIGVIRHEKLQYELLKKVNQQKV